MPVPGAAPRADGHLPGTSDSLAAPVIVLSYGHSGAHLIQRALADGTDRYPGNSVAAVAAYWASATEQLLAFEAASPAIRQPGAL